jgi:hypothetical protein
MTRKILNRLPEKVTTTLDMWNDRYHDDRLNQDITRAEIRGYVKGLADAGLLKTDLEFRIIFGYATL